MARPHSDQAARKPAAAARHAALSERTRRQDIAGRRPRYQREPTHAPQQEPQGVVAVIAVRQDEVSAALALTSIA